MRLALLGALVVAAFLIHPAAGGAAIIAVALLARKS